MAFFGGEEWAAARQGLYFCRTAGDNVLYATNPQPCTAVAKPNDMIMGLADTGTGEIVVAVSSIY